MTTAIEIVLKSLTGSLHWFYRSVLFDVPWHQNYFWGLTLISFVIWGLEMLFPWRKNQSFFRKDFWLDAFYMYFNFFLFTVVISGVYALISNAFSNVGISMDAISIIDIQALPNWFGLLIFFVLLDFVQWFTHVLLHKTPFLWQFHKVHHSVKEMGFAAHLRYHWMENIFYKPLKTFAVMILFGFEPEQAYIVHFIAITIGHFNHANIKITWGPLKYIINNPVMHLQHHAYDVPEGRYGVNFGISLSLWDYIFKTNYIPEDSGTIDLGFPGVDKFPKSFIDQNTYGFRKGNN